MASNIKHSLVLEQVCVRLVLRLLECLELSFEQLESRVLLAHHNILLAGKRAQFVAKHFLFGAFIHSHSLEVSRADFCEKIGLFALQLRNAFLRALQNLLNKGLYTR